MAYTSEKGYIQRGLLYIWFEFKWMGILKVIWFPKRLVKIKSLFYSLFYDSKIGLDTESISFYLTIGSSCCCDMLLIG